VVILEIVLVFHGAGLSFSEISLVFVEIDLVLYEIGFLLFEIDLRYVEILSVPGDFVYRILNRQGILTSLKKPPGR